MAYLHLKSVSRALLATVVVTLVCTPGFVRAAVPDDLALLSNARNMVAIGKLPPPTKRGFSFIVVGDNRDGDKTFRALLAQMEPYLHGKIGASKADPAQRPLFVIHTGDMVAHGTKEEWASFAAMRSMLDVPMVYVPGNHEMRDPAGKQNYQTLVGDLNWSFDFGGYRFIGLDDTGGAFAAGTIAFTRAQLGLGADKPSRYVKAPPPALLFFHEPPAVGRWIVHSMKSDADGGRGGELMAAVKEAHAAGVFLGHIHLYDQMEIDGIPYVISGGGGAPLYSQYGFGTVENGFVIVHVGPHGLTWEWVSLAS